MRNAQTQQLVTLTVVKFLSLENTQNMFKYKFIVSNSTISKTQYLNVKNGAQVASILMYLSERRSR